MWHEEKYIKNNCTFLLLLLRFVCKHVLHGVVMHVLLQQNFDTILKISYCIKILQYTYVYEREIVVFT